MRFTAHSLETSKYIENVNMTRDLKRWGEISRNLLIWDYSTNWRFYQQPMATVTSIQPNFRFFRDNGAKYLYVEGGERWVPAGTDPAFILNNAIESNPTYSILTQRSREVEEL